MLSHTRRPISRSLNVSLFLTLLLAACAGLILLTRQAGAVVAPNSKTEKTFPLNTGPLAQATPTPWPTLTKCPSSRWSAEGNVNDSNGINTTGTLENNATYGPGATGQSFNLDGNQAYVKVPIVSPKMDKPVSFTWEACVYPLSLAGNPVVFSKEAAALNRAGLQINSNGSLCSYMNSSSCNGTTVMGMVVPNQFTKLTLIYNGATQKLITYKNGLQVGSVTVSAPYDHSNTPAAFNIGWSPYGGGNTHFPGFIDEACGPAPSPTPTPIP